MEFEFSIDSGNVVVSLLSDWGEGKELPSFWIFFEILEEMQNKKETVAFAATVQTSVALKTTDLTNNSCDIHNTQ